MRSNSTEVFIPDINFSDPILQSHRLSLSWQTGGHIPACESDRKKLEFTHDRSMDLPSARGSALRYRKSSLSQLIRAALICDALSATLGRSYRIDGSIVTVIGPTPPGTDLADRVFVLHYGKELASGAPEDVLKHSKVIDAYLGRSDCQVVDAERSCPGPIELLVASSALAYT
jgi:hypothetical protein